jgi:hypothetical protein
MRKEEQREGKQTRSIKEHREFQIGGSAVLTSLVKKGVQKTKGIDKDFCNRNYFKGRAEPDGCSYTKDGAHIETPAECRWAADKMHKHAGNDHVGPFEVKDQWFIHSYPEGCFVSANDDTTFWYNTEGEVSDGQTSKAIGTSQAPEGTTGFPICWRPKYDEGTIDTNGDCPDDMAPILNEFDCRTYAECMGDKPADDDNSFRVGIPAYVPPMQGQTEDPAQDQPDHRPEGWGNPHIWPQGCFIRTNSNGSINYNANMTVTPSDPKGTPACSRPWVTDPAPEASGTSGAF